jgi:hypothetical protein
MWVNFCSKYENLFGSSQRFGLSGDISTSKSRDKSGSLESSVRQTGIEGNTVNLDCNGKRLAVRDTVLIVRSRISDLLCKQAIILEFSGSKRLVSDAFGNLKSVENVAKVDPQHNGRAVWFYCSSLMKLKPDENTLDKVRNKEILLS